MNIMIDMINIMKKYLYAALFYEEQFEKLKYKKWWARGLNILYRVGVVVTIMYFIIVVINDEIFSYEPSGIFYAFVAMTAVLSGGIVAYHVLIWSILYIVYGRNEGILNKVDQASETFRSLYSYVLFWVTFYFIIIGTVWLFLGA